ncbi:hypothetical protein EV363DRAFT_1361390 [Boletus edulis]|nr:hypothetical protein EV363DRAFT_1361390 [Boletus edulis]
MSAVSSWTRRLVVWAVWGWTVAARWSSVAVLPPSVLPPISSISLTSSQARSSSGSSGGSCDTPAGLVGSAHLAFEFAMSAVSHFWGLTDVRRASAPSLLSSELLAGVARLTPSVRW